MYQRCLVLFSRCRLELIDSKFNNFFVSLVSDEYLLEPHCKTKTTTHHGLEQSISGLQII